MLTAGQLGQSPTCRLHGRVEVCAGMKHLIRLGAVAVVLVAGVRAQDLPAEAEAVRKELEQLRQDYENRIRVLEEQLRMLEQVAQAVAGSNALEAVAATNLVERRVRGESTESRERAMAQLEKRTVQKRVEHVLTEFVDIGGYFRGGYGRNDKGSSQVPFQAPGAPAKYRLGNETENYGELTFGKDWYVPDLFSFAASSVTEDTANRPLTHIQIRAAFVDPYSNYGSPDSFQATLPEVWASVGNIWKAKPDLKLWAGNRYYRRHDIHINDFYFLNMSGGGGGFEDLQLPFGKLAGAWIGDGAQSGIFRDPILSDPNNKAGFSKQNGNISGRLK